MGVQRNIQIVIALIVSFFALAGTLGMTMMDFNSPYRSPEENAHFHSDMMWWVAIGWLIALLFWLPVFKKQN
jgi:hypothetical protein